MNSETYGYSSGDILYVDLGPNLPDGYGYVYYSESREEYRICFGEDRTGKW